MLIDKQSHRFKPDSSFEAVFNIYKFDRELRLLTMCELEKIEVAFRSRMIFYVLSRNRGAFWYLEPENFTNQNNPNEATAVRFCPAKWIPVRVVPPLCFRCGPEG